MYLSFKTIKTFVLNMMQTYEQIINKLKILDIIRIVLNMMQTSEYNQKAKVKTFLRLVRIHYGKQLTAFILEICTILYPSDNPV